MAGFIDLLCKISAIAQYFRREAALLWACRKVRKTVAQLEAELQRLDRESAALVPVVSHHNNGYLRTLAAGKIACLAVRRRELLNKRHTAKRELARLEEL